MFACKFFTVKFLSWSGLSNHIRNLLHAGGNLCILHKWNIELLHLKVNAKEIGDVDY